MLGLNECMNTQDCLGQHRVCSHEKQELKGECVCEKGYELISPNSFACVKKGLSFVLPTTIYVSLHYNI